MILLSFSFDLVEKKERANLIRHYHQMAIAQALSVFVNLLMLQTENLL